MKPTQHPSNTRVLGAPIGWDQQYLPCGALPITESALGDILVIKSYWRPTAEELQRLANGGMVELMILGKSMPPVAINVEGGT